MKIYNVGFENSEGIQDETQIDVEEYNWSVDEEIEFINVILSLKDEMDIQYINYIEEVEEDM